MLGRSAGLTEQKLAYLSAEEPPAGVYDTAEWTIVRYARRLTNMEPIDDDLYSELERHFEQRQIIELAFTVGLNNLVSRFHATFHTDLDEATSDQVAVACPVPLPPPPG